MTDDELDKRIEVLQKQQSEARKSDYGKFGDDPVYSNIYNPELERLQAEWQRRSRLRSQRKQRNRLIIVGVVAVILLWLFA